MLLLINLSTSTGPRGQGRDRKLGTPVTMSGPIKTEHVMVLKSLIECIGSRLSQEVLLIIHRYWRAEVWEPRNLHLCSLSDLLIWRVSYCFAVFLIFLVILKFCYALSQDQVIFFSVVKDVFGNISDRTTVTHSKEELEVENILTKNVQEKGLIAHPPWISKATQLYQLSKVYHGKLLLIPIGSRRMFYFGFL